MLHACRGPAIPSWILLPITAAAVLAVFLTTDRGRRLAARLGIGNPFAGGVDRETQRWLVEACAGDVGEVTRRVERERARFPDLDEASLYRRAVRTLMNERGGPREIGEDRST